MWRILREHLSELKPDHVILMDLTWLELPLCFRKPSCTFSGILFVQYPELCSAPKPGWRRWVKFWLKDIKTHRFLNNRMVRRVYLLNGEYSCKFLNNRFGVACYFPVPDPVPVREADPNTQMCRDFGVEAGRRVFLFFGSMSPRKGVGELVAALGLLSSDAARQAAFVFCGVPEPQYAKHYHASIKQLQRERPDIVLHVEERFVETARMRALFEQADWILMPYNRPEYSSGILAHAAAAQTPVIGPAGGLVGRLVREYGLGMGVPPDALASAIEKAVTDKHEFNETARQAFVDASSPERFATTLLDQ